MRERAEPALKITCLILAAFVVYQLVGVLMRFNPLHGVIVPALPSLTASTNTPASGGHGTNPATAASAGAKGTNSAQSSAGSASATISGTNSMLTPAPTGSATDSGSHERLAKADTNTPPRLEAKTGQTNPPASVAAAGIGTNLSAAATDPGTNGSHPAKPAAKSPGPIPPPGMAGMNFNPFSPRGKPADDLPPAVQARITRITDSEILGPVVRPLPMGLLGIAGDVAFLRTATGQTGLVKEGDSLGELKLLRIGINRVLIEQDGQKKELTIFSGYGGESLLTK
jgi:hypothetical protein